MAASLLVLIDWVILLVRDSQGSPLRGGVTFVDCFIILGIAWIPCFFLLQIRSAGLRTRCYLAASLAALIWIGWHTPTHAVFPHFGTDTAAVSVAVPFIGFAFLNLALVVLRSRETGSSPPGTGATQVRLAWATSAAACLGAIASPVIVLSLAQ